MEGKVATFPQHETYASPLRAAFQMFPWILDAFC